MRKPAPDPRLEVRLVGRRGKELAAALETDILPVQSSRGQPKREFVKSGAGNLWEYIADTSRLTDQQIKRLALALAAKYTDQPDWGDAEQMEQTIRNFGFTVPIDDCVVIAHMNVTQTSFTDLSQPKDT